MRYFSFLDKIYSNNTFEELFPGVVFNIKSIQIFVITLKELCFNGFDALT
jgi:hypothetical protein